MTAQARERINQVTSTNLRPASERAQSRTRFGTANETLQPAQLWPEDWVVDRAAFRKSVNDFLTVAGFSRQLNSQERQTDQFSSLSSAPSDLDQDVRVSLQPSNKAHPPQPRPIPKDTLAIKTPAPPAPAPSRSRPGMAGESSSDQPVSGFLSNNAPNWSTNYTPQYEDITATT